MVLNTSSSLYEHFVFFYNVLGYSLRSNPIYELSFQSSGKLIVSLQLVATIVSIYLPKLAFLVELVVLKKNLSLLDDGRDNLS